MNEKSGIKKKKVSTKKLIFLGVVVGVVIGSIGSYSTAVVVEETSDKAFCTKCHTMKPMGDSYSMDVHGGNNKNGVVVKCVDCHLPHDSLINYLKTKAQTGTHDVWAEMTYDKTKIDWEEKRKHRAKFVYDSGCLKCHTNLKDATMASAKAFVAHKDYYLNKTKSCVECHKNVGHKNLGHFLKKPISNLKEEVK